MFANDVFFIIDNGKQSHLGFHSFDITCVNIETAREMTSMNVYKTARDFSRRAWIIRSIEHKGYTYNCLIEALVTNRRRLDALPISGLDYYAFSL